MQAGSAVTTDHSQISAVKRRPSGAEGRRKKRGGENVLWHRVTANFDDAVKRFAASPEIASPITRLVFFKHLTVRQGMAARRYRDIMRAHDRFFVDTRSRSTKSADLEPTRKSEDDELNRHFWNGSLGEYEDDARKAKRHFKTLTKVLDAFADRVTGRNVAKSVLDDLCLSDIEPPAQWRQNLAHVLSAIAEAFDIQEQGRKR